MAPLVCPSGIVPEACCWGTALIILQGRKERPSQYASTACPQPSLTLAACRQVRIVPGTALAMAESWQNNCSAIGFIPTIPYAIQRQTFSEDFWFDFFVPPPRKNSSLSMDFDCYINLI